ncbi:MAG TPA: hypothetical protein VFH95_15590 [Candidatus Kapabacteria bacterium]|nr:hypothetical protein [Candidatus Kapabacteria bacterium]
MPTIPELLASLRNGGHLDADHLIGADKLADALGLPAEPNQELLRALIRNAIDAGELIGSRSGRNGGYWLIGSRAELEFVLKSLADRAEETLIRRNNLRKSWNIGNPGDRTLLIELHVRP